MRGPTGRSSTSRRVHLVLLTGAVAVVAALSFWRRQSWDTRVVVILLSLLAARGIASTRDAGHLERSRLEDPLLGLVGAALALVLMRGWGLAPIVAATLVGAAGGLAVRLTKGANDYHGAPVYVGAFVGITSPLVLHQPWWVLIAGTLAGAAWSMSREAWIGVGGKMGTVALLATFATTEVARALGERESGGPALDAHGFLLAAYLTGLAAAPLTYFLAHRLRWGAVLASAVPTVAFAGIMAMVPAGSRALPGVLASLWYGSSFVGMTTPSRVRGSVVAVALGGVIFTWLALHFGHYFSGLGGTAGLTALLAVFVVRGAQAIVSDRVALARR